jgi:hypothetical protein
MNDLARSLAPQANAPGHAAGARRIVFICAAGHSGSTLLNLCLGAHPQGFAVGEITQFPKNLALDSTCSCGKPVSHCTFWKPFVDDYGRLIGADLWHKPYQLDLGPIMAGKEIDREHQTAGRMLWRKIRFASEYGRLAKGWPGLPGAKRSLARSGRNKLQFLSRLFDAAGARFIVDSSKHYLDAWHLYQADPASVRIIMLYRDGRAVFASGLKRGMSPADALAAWKRPNERAQAIINRHVPDDARMDCHYESLAANPKAELRRLAEFIGVDYDPAMLEFGTRENHIANGNRMRLQHGSEIRLDEAWRRSLDREQLAYFEVRAGKTNRNLGYRD